MVSTGQLLGMHCGSRIVFLTAVCLVGFSIFIPARALSAAPAAPAKAEAAKPSPAPRAADAPGIVKKDVPGPSTATTPSTPTTRPVVPAPTNPAKHVVRQTTETVDRAAPAPAHTPAPAAQVTRQVEQVAPTPQAAGETVQMVSRAVPSDTTRGAPPSTRDDSGTTRVGGGAHLAPRVTPSRRSVADRLAGHSTSPAHAARSLVSHARHATRETPPAGAPGSFLAEPPTAVQQAARVGEPSRPEVPRNAPLPAPLPGAPASAGAAASGGFGGPDSTGVLAGFILLTITGFGRRLLPRDARRRPRPVVVLERPG